MFQANSGMVKMASQVQDATASVGADDSRSTSSPSVGSSTTQRQSPSATKTRVPIRVTDPETKEDLTEKLAEMYAQVNEARRKKGETQTNTSPAVTPMPHPSDTDTTGHTIQVRTNI